MMPVYNNIGRNASKHEIINGTAETWPVRSSAIQEGLGIAASPPHQDEPAEVVWAPIYNAPLDAYKEVFWTCPFGRRPWGRPKTCCFLAGLGNLQDQPRGAGGGGRGRWSQGFSALAAAPVTKARISRWTHDVEANWLYLILPRLHVH